MSKGELRYRVFRRTLGHCGYCRIKLAWINHGLRGFRGAWEMDHLIPVCRRGETSIRNLVAACWRCNAEKAMMTALEFIYWLETDCIPPTYARWLNSREARYN